MNFFQYQERARSRTKLLVFLFVLAVVLMAAAIYFVVVLTAGGLEAQEMGEGGTSPWWWDPLLFAIVLVGTVAVIGLGSLYRTLTLSQGGGVVARMLGGRLVDRDTKDPAEKRLLNVVEEMAIASGVPVPEVYVLDGEMGINAFAAGYSPDQAAVAVTRGTLETMNRNELQGIVAHEFSHIFNGDMRLNIRLIGVLFGILVITVIGRILLRTGSSSGSRRSKGQNPLPLIGLGLVIIGYIGLIIGRVIQAAVSRQREFLADSSAVQFTRDPGGIGMALRKIMVHAQGSRLASAHTTEVGHLLFGAGEGGFLAAVLATHPPLEDRIRRIDPNLLNAEVKMGEPELKAARVGPASLFQNKLRVNAAQVIEQVGKLDSRTLALSAALLAGVPNEAKEASRGPGRARQLIFALLLDARPEVRAVQLTILREKESPAASEASAALFSKVAALDTAARLPLVEMSVPALRQLPPAERNKFLQTVNAIILADRKVTLFEFAIRCLLEHRLQEQKGPRPVLYRDVEKLAWHEGHLLAALALAGNAEDRGAAEQAFRLGLARLGTSKGEMLLEAFRAGRLGDLQQVQETLRRLPLAANGVKQATLDAVAACVMADKMVSPQEAELVRLVAAILDAPLPPFLSERAA